MTSNAPAKEQRLSVELPRRNAPPPLPPRTPSSYEAPPAYSLEDQRTSVINEQWRSYDPRSSSTQSLVPSESGRDGRRTLLLIFIHGFMGNETSFQSFPAHVHNLLTITMSSTHVVHTKIYPRYKSRKAIEFARDDFSKWLEPHESPTTDVILLGHSMGGLLAAEVALLPPSSPAIGKALHHRILGTISFDTPFLGMHPGVIISGIGSLFRPAPAAPGLNETAVGRGATSPSSDSQLSMSMSNDSSWTASTPASPPAQLTNTQSHTSSMLDMPVHDPNYNPPFPNDVRQTERSGWRSVMHFINKHSDGLTTATAQYFTSHIEFGGCLADYPGLKTRYAKLRSLEDVDELAGQDGPGYKPAKQRVRFLNYYTASTGIPKKPKSPKIPSSQIDEDGHLKPMEVEMTDMSLSDASSRSGVTTPRISVDEYNDRGVQSQNVEEGLDASPVAARNPSALEHQVMNLGASSGVHDSENDHFEMRHIDSMPIPDDDEPYGGPHSTNPDAEAGNLDPVVSTRQSELGSVPSRTNSEPPLPPIPSIPTEPDPIDLTAYTDKDSRKLAEKEQKRVIKAYQQAVKDRENAIKDRRKLVEKREKRARQEADKALKAEQKQRLKEEKEEEKRLATVNPEPKPVPKVNANTEAGERTEKPKRDKKFCMLPPDINGKRDRCWVRVYMEGVDEVGAHCGLFFAGPQYESLVGDVGAKVEEWVKEDATRRAVLEAEAEEGLGRFGGGA